MAEPTMVSINLLRTSAAVLIDHLESLGGDTIRLNHDYYWEIASDQRFDPYVEPSSFTLGQLSDCVENLDRMTTDPSSAISFGLVWLGELFKTIGQDVVR